MKPSWRSFVKCLFQNLWILKLVEVGPHIGCGVLRLVYQLIWVEVLPFWVCLQRVGPLVLFERRLLQWLGFFGSLLLNEAVCPSTCEREAGVVDSRFMLGAGSVFLFLLAVEGYSFDFFLVRRMEGLTSRDGSSLFSVLFGNAIWFSSVETDRESYVICTSSSESSSSFLSSAV